jgi:hypothetical protein
VIDEPGAAAATPGLSNDVIPTGYVVLQLLNDEGSTATTQTSNLAIVNGPWDFAVNAQDMANGWTFIDGVPTTTVGSPDDPITISDIDTPIPLDGWNLSIQGQNTPPGSSAPNVTVTDTLRYYISDDGVTVNYDVSSGDNDPVGSLSDTPKVQIANYTTVDFFLPYESVTTAPYANYVVLGSTSFSDTPVVVADNGGLVLNASVNFYDNRTDTGGSDPGGPDNLVLGHTNFAYNPGQNPAGLQIADIGHDTVSIDANTVTTSINDYGTGSFEIGATNANVLEAASTSHLIQDVSATLDYYTFNSLTGPEGITVTGSATGQNLLQGTSGTVFVDPASNGDHGAIFAPPDSSDGSGPFQGVGTFDGSTTGHGDAVTFGGVGNTLEATVQSGGPDGGWGSDTLTGGIGGGGGADPTGVPNVEEGGLLGTYTGNTGDNYFPEGGNDVVNLAHATSGYVADSTVWFGMYDVSNSGDYYGILGDSGVGVVYGQAVTDIIAGSEVYVDGYGPGTANSGGVTGSTTSSLEINNFVAQTGVSNTGADSGDVINLDVNDWATGHLNGSTSATTNLDLGLVEADGKSLASLGTHNANADVFSVGATTFGNVSDPHANVILDAFGTYGNASQLVTGLEGAGAITLGSVLDPNIITNGSIEHLLIAYQTTAPGLQVNIDDVTLTNNSGHSINLSSFIGLAGAGTATTGLTVSATDMITLNNVHPTGVSLATLHDWNFHFV